MILDRPIAGAKEGTNYLKLYDPDTMGTELNQEFMLAGWGTSGNMNDPSFDRTMSVLHRGYNYVSEIDDNLLYYEFDRLE